MPDGTVPTPGRRQLLVGGTALLAALGLEPTASAAAGRASASMPFAARRTRGCTAGRATPGTASTR